MIDMTYKILSDEILAIKLLIVEDYKNKEFFIDDIKLKKLKLNEQFIITLKVYFKQLKKVLELSTTNSDRLIKEFLNIHPVFQKNRDFNEFELIFKSFVLKDIYTFLMLLNIKEFLLIQKIFLRYFRRSELYKLILKLADNPFNFFKMKDLIQFSVTKFDFICERIQFDDIISKNCLKKPNDLEFKYVFYCEFCEKDFEDFLFNRYYSWYDKKNLKNSYIYFKKKIDYSTKDILVTLEKELTKNIV